MKMSMQYLNYYIENSRKKNVIFFKKSPNSCDQIPFETSVSGVDRHSNFKIVSEGRAVRI